jgi:hypothetical protein
MTKRDKTNELSFEIPATDEAQALIQRCLNICKDSA